MVRGAGKLQYKRGRRVKTLLSWQTTTLRHLQAELLEADEDWAGAARALARIPLEGGSR